MEIVIVVFLGVWFSVAGIVAYLFVKHDFKNIKEEHSDE